MVGQRKEEGEVVAEKRTQEVNSGLRHNTGVSILENKPADMRFGNTALG